MSLLDYESSVPWAESMRLELISGHMPPWSVESGAARFSNVRTLSGRELNVLLTWAAGGTPRGSAPPAAATSGSPDWRLGPPDLILAPATEFVLGADVRERVETFTLDVPTREPRWVRVVDVRPGNPGIVRRAVVSIDAGAADSTDRPGLAMERRLALWLPGDNPTPLEPGAGFLLPAGARLAVQVHYRKTWLNEHDAVRDRSSVGLYFAEAPAVDVRAIHLAPSQEDIARMVPAGALVFSTRVDADVEAVAVYPGEDFHGATVTVHASRPDGGADEPLIAFRPLEDWARRYWYRTPIHLPAGTLIQARVTFDASPALIAPGVPPRAPSDPAGARLTLNVLRVR